MSWEQRVKNEPVGCDTGTSWLAHALQRKSRNI